MSIKVFLKYLHFYICLWDTFGKLFHFIMFCISLETISHSVNIFPQHKMTITRLTVYYEFFLCIDHKMYLGIVTSMFTRMKRARVTPCTTAAALNWSLIMKNKIIIKITHLQWCLWSDKQACESLNNVLNLNLLIEN